MIEQLVRATVTGKSGTAPKQYNRKRPGRERKACMWTRALTGIPKSITIPEEDRKPQLSAEGIGSASAVDVAGEAGAHVARTGSASSSLSLLQEGSVGTMPTFDRSPSDSSQWDGIGPPRKMVSWGSGQSIDRFLAKSVLSRPCARSTCSTMPNRSLPLPTLMVLIRGQQGWNLCLGG